jgi:hypothetical protein
MSTWEERMSARHHQRVGLDHWRLPSDPPNILPEILEARAESREYGDPGPPLPPGEWPTCRECWADHYVWYGNTWGLKHVDRQPGDPLYAFHGGALDCRHECHESDPPAMAMA